MKQCRQKLQSHVQPYHRIIGYFLLNAFSKRKIVENPLCDSLFLVIASMTNICRFVSPVIYFSLHSPNKPPKNIFFQFLWFSLLFKTLNINYSPNVPRVAYMRVPFSLEKTLLTARKFSFKKARGNSIHFRSRLNLFC